MEVQLLKRRISSPRAATVVALAAVVALAVTVTPSLAKKAESFLTAKKAAATYVSNKKASTLYLRKKAASNLFVAKSAVPQPSVVGIAAGTATFGPISSPTAGYIPTAFTSFATPAKVSSAVITFSGNATCTAPKPGPDQACPIAILVDGQVAAQSQPGPLDGGDADAGADRRHGDDHDRPRQGRAHGRRPVRRAPKTSASR